MSTRFFSTRSSYQLLRPLLTNVDRAIAIWEGGSHLALLALWPLVHGDGAARVDDLDQALVARRAFKPKRRELPVEAFAASARSATIRSGDVLA